mgnify:CR=1 FL=1
MDWQPIETAPRDGRQLLFWSRHGFCEVLRRDHWGWMNEGGEGYDDASDTLTHWMPLPAPPASADGATGTAE